MKHMKNILFVLLVLVLLSFASFIVIQRKQAVDRMPSKSPGSKAMSATVYVTQEAVYAAKPLDGTSAWMTDSLACDGDSVYFAGERDGAWKLFKADRDGSSPQTLTEVADESIDSLCCMEGHIFALASRIEEDSNGAESACFWLLEIDTAGNELRRTAIGGEGWPDDFWPSYIVGIESQLYICGLDSLCAVQPDSASTPLFTVSTGVGAMPALLSDGQPVLGMPGTDGGYSLQVVESDGVLGEMRELENGFIRVYSGGERFSLYLADGSALYGYDWDSGTLTRLLTWSQMGITGGAVLEASAESFLCLGQTGIMEPGCLMQLQKTDLDPSAAGPLVLATLNSQDASICMEDSIGAWNRAHPDCPIELRDYSAQGGDGQPPELRLLTDIASGNAPDMFDFSAYFYTRNTNLFSVGLLARRGLLEDLYPWLEGESELMESLDTSLLSAFEMDGKLYEAVVGMLLYTCCGNASELGQDPSGWTWEALEEKLTQNSRASCLLVDGTFSEDLLSMLVSLSGDKLVDWSSGTCAFDSDYFLHLLQAVKNRSRICDGMGANEANDAAWDPAVNNALLVFYSDSPFSSFPDPLWEERCLVGLPEVGPVAEAYLGLGICSLSERKDLCWEFVKSLYDDVDYHGVPLHREHREALAAEHLSEYDDDSLLAERGITKESFAAYMEKSLAHIDTIRVVRRYDAQIDQIVRSEAGAYLNGQRSAEETAKAIQSRVSIYMAEQQ